MSEEKMTVANCEELEVALAQAKAALAPRSNKIGGHWRGLGRREIQVVD